MPICRSIVPCEIFNSENKVTEFLVLWLSFYNINTNESFGYAFHNPDFAIECRNQVFASQQKTIKMIMQTIIGGNGTIGKEVAKQLHNMNIQVRIASRTPKKVNANDQVFEMDVFNEQSVSEAIKG
jgi:hypothetical protein